jgi:hypothetical protein
MCFQSFILDVYNRCKDIGLSPENISFLVDLLEFSKTIMPLPKIPGYIKEKTSEKRKLEEEIENLKVQIEALQMQKKMESRRDKAQEVEGMTSSQSQWYASLREELRKYGILVDDTSKFAKVVNNIKEYGYDAALVIKEFSDVESLKTNYQYYLQNLQSLENKVTEVNQTCALELSANMHTQFQIQSLGEYGLWA